VDLVIPLPLGTVIRDAQSGAELGELVNPGDEIVVAKGGRHGLGNIHWASATHQAPEEFRPGGPGEEKELVLDLKLIADVGFAGFPNAGKSTLLSRISAARPKIADYPFTTLVPSLGVVDVGGDGEFSMRSLVVADIPGLIEGASEGRGLGLQFLKHLERTSLVAYVIDAGDFERAPSDALTILESELAKFSPEMAGKKALLILNKIDLLDSETLDEVKLSMASRGLPTVAISGVTGAGLQVLKEKLYELVQEEKAKREQETNPAQPAWDDLRDGSST
jgi:GTP-binding protein